MLKSILITTLVATTILVADNSYLGKIVSKGTPPQQVKKVKKTKKFRKDDHRYDKRYRDFDYDRNGYYNNDGFYFGFFDRNGYFFNNIYFEYDSRYSYRDRYYRRGYFEPSYHHYRRCNYDNDWNRGHRYREPTNIIVYGNYYENQSEPYYRGEGHVTSHRYREDRRDSYRRDYSYRNSHYNSYRNNSYNRRDSYEREYHRDRGRVINHRFSNRSSGNVHNRKSNKNKGRLQITK